MKPWQKGFDLDYLKELELRFSSYNDYAQHELSKFKKNNIADALSKDNIILLRDDAIIHFNEVKVKGRAHSIKAYEVLGQISGKKDQAVIKVSKKGFELTLDKEEISDKKQILDILEKSIDALSGQ